jgi:hypothetical protein
MRGENYLLLKNFPSTLRFECVTLTVIQLPHLSLSQRFTKTRIFYSSLTLSPLNERKVVRFPLITNLNCICLFLEHNNSFILHKLV